MRPMAGTTEAPHIISDTTEMGGGFCAWLRATGRKMFAAGRLAPDQRYFAGAAAFDVAAPTTTMASRPSVK